MRQVTLRLDDDLHRAAKIRAVMQDKSFMQYVLNLIRKDLGTKKSSHAEFGDLRDCSRTESRLSLHLSVV